MTNKQYIAHHGIKGQKWGVRRYQNEDGTLTEAGRRHYQKLDDRWIKRKSDKVYDKSMKESRKEMNEYVRRDLRGVKGATAVNAYNKKLAEVMRTKTKDIRSPSGKVVEWVAKRGSVGVFMALADQGYNMGQLKQGVWSSGRIGYRRTGQKGSTVDMTQNK